MSERATERVIVSGATSAKAGRRTAVMVLVEYPEKPDNEKPYEKPRTRLQPYSIGDVRGVRALDTAAVKALSVAARAVKVAWSDRQASEEVSLRKLRELGNTLEGLGQIEGQAEAAADTWNSFREPANLGRCAFLTRNDEAQRGVFELARSGSSRKAARGVASGRQTDRVRERRAELSDSLMAKATRPEQRASNSRVGLARAALY